MQNEIPLFQKIYDFYKLYYQLIDHFPQKSRGVLGKKIEDLILELLRLISRARFAQGQEKLRLLKKTSGNLDFLKTLFRLAFEIKAIDQKKYFLFEEKLQEMGRMLGSWIKERNNARSLKQAL